VPIQRGKVRFRRKYPVFLVFNGTYRAGLLRNSLKLRRGFGIIGREFYWSESGKLSRRAEMPFMKSNGKSEFILLFVESHRK